jgi:hypothetical protein
VPAGCLIGRSLAAVPPLQRGPSGPLADGLQAPGLVAPALCSRIGGSIPVFSLAGTAPAGGGTHRHGSTRSDSVSWARSQHPRETDLSRRTSPSFAMPTFVPVTGRHGHEGLLWYAPPSQAAEGFVQRAATDPGTMVPHPAVLPEVIDVLIFPHTPS